MSILFRLFLVLVSLSSALALAQTTPQYLFHWTSARGLQRWADLISSEVVTGVDFKQRNEFAFKKLDSLSILLGVYPELQNRDGVFVWSNLATGMGSFTLGGTEWYSREEKSGSSVTEAARLVVFEMVPEASTLELTTYLDYSKDPVEIVTKDSNIQKLDSGRKTGLILHKIYDANTNELKIQEYVILRRGVVKSMTANPRENKRFIEAEITNISNNKKYSLSELHAPSQADEYGINSSVAKRMFLGPLKRALEVPTERIPPFFAELHCKTLLK